MRFLEWWVAEQIGRIAQLSGMPVKLDIEVSSLGSQARPLYRYHVEANPRKCEYPGCPFPAIRKVRWVDTSGRVREAWLCGMHASLIETGH